MAEKSRIQWVKELRDCDAEDVGELLRAWHAAQPTLDIFTFAPQDLHKGVLGILQEKQLSEEVLDFLEELEEEGIAAPESLLASYLSDAIREDDATSCGRVLALLGAQHYLDIENIFIRRELSEQRSSLKPIEYAVKYFRPDCVRVLAEKGLKLEDSFPDDLLSREARRTYQSPSYREEDPGKVAVLLLELGVPLQENQREKLYTFMQNHFPVGIFAHLNKPFLPTHNDVGKILRQTEGKDVSEKRKQQFIGEMLDRLTVDDVSQVLRHVKDELWLVDMAIEKGANPYWMTENGRGIIDTNTRYGQTPDMCRHLQSFGCFTTAAEACKTAKNVKPERIEQFLPVALHAGKLSLGMIGQWAKNAKKTPEELLSELSKEWQKNDHIIQLRQEQARLSAAASGQLQKLAKGAKKRGVE